MKHFIPQRVRAGQTAEVKMLSVQNITAAPIYYNKKLDQEHTDFRSVYAQYSCKNFWSLIEKIDINEIDTLGDNNKKHGMSL